MKEADVRRVRQDLGELLDDGEEMEDVAAAERLGVAFLAMGQVSGAGPELARTALESLEESGDARAAGVLAAMAVFARPPLAEEAGAALERLHLAGVRSPVEGQVGTLVVEEARRLELGPGEVLVALLRRPGAREVQAAMVIVEREETGGAAVGGSLSPPGPPRSLERALRKMAGALGNAGAFAPLVVDGAHELPLDPEDDDELEAATEELAEHLLEVNEGDPVVERSGPFVAQTMVDYKWRYGDRRLRCWRIGDLDEYLLDYFPRKVSTDHELVLDTPTCVVAFLTMLDDHGALEGPPLEVLSTHVEAITEDFRRAVRDPRRWGPAKSAMMAMLDDGVDPEDEDEDAVAGWIDAVNARGAASGAASPPRADAGPRPDDAARRGGRASSAARAGKRKSQRAARQRNRR